MSEADLVEGDLLLDRRVYGTCFWKFIDGKKVRVPPQDVRIVRGVPRDSKNEKLEHEILR